MELEIMAIVSCSNMHVFTKERWGGGRREVAVISWRILSHEKKKKTGRVDVLYFYAVE